MTWLDWLHGLLSPFRDPPVATLFIFIVGILVEVFAGVIQRRLTDVKKVERWRREMARWQRELNRAKSKGDKKQIEKASSMIVSINWRILRETAYKSMLILSIPFLAIFMLLSSFYGRALIAKLPFPFLPVPGFVESVRGANYLTWVGWYILTTYSTGLVIFKALGVRPVVKE